MTVWVVEPMAMGMELRPFSVVDPADGTSGSYLA